MILAAAVLNHGRLTFKFLGLAQRHMGVENPEAVLKVFGGRSRFGYVM